MEFGDFRTSHKASARFIFDFGGTDWWVVNGGVG